MTADSNSDSEINDQNSSKIENASTDSATFSRLAQLSPAEYDRVRKLEARLLRIRIQTLDDEVARLKAQFNRDNALNSSLSTLQSLVPWPDPVNGAEVLLQVAGQFERYILLPAGGSHANTLWTAHAHCFAAFLHTPRLNLCSPKPDCGKTTTLDLIATMTPRPLRTENLTAPVLFRLVDQHQPTLLLDEVDAYLPQAEELRGLLNAGHKRGACAYRCEGENNNVRAFKAFGPAVLAGIGSLPGTLHDRSIRIVLLQAEPEQLKARFDGFHIELETELARKLARWTSDNYAALQACDPPLPPEAFNRTADNWRPLFAIAHVAGGDWPRLALEAFHHLSNASIAPAAPNPLAALLADIQQIFAQSGAACLSTKQLLASLQAAHAARPTSAETPPLDAMQLARQLRPLGIHSQNITVGKLRAKGYHLADFTTRKLSETT
jgi:putative DNA primase/helicase